MPIDQDYVKSMEAWFKTMDIGNEQLKNMIDFHSKEIDIHTKLLSINKEILQHDETRYNKSKDDFDKYMASNE